jgi:hypothetical protein
MAMEILGVSSSKSFLQMSLFFFNSPLWGDAAGRGVLGTSAAEGLISSEFLVLSLFQ